MRNEKYNYPYCNLQVKCKLNIVFKVKDKSSLLTWSVKNGDRNANYYGKIKYHFKVRMYEQLATSALIVNEL